jgi:hypothetical protein
VESHQIIAEKFTFYFPFFRKVESLMFLLPLSHVYKWIFENPIRLHDPITARLLGLKKTFLKKGRALRNESFMHTPISTLCAMHDPGSLFEDSKIPIVHVYPLYTLSFHFFGPWIFMVQKKNVHDPKKWKVEVKTSNFPLSTFQKNRK